MSSIDEAVRPRHSFKCSLRRCSIDLQMLATPTLVTLLQFVISSTLCDEKP